MTNEMQGALGSEAALSGFRDQIDQQIGGETSVINEDVTQSGDVQVYTRTAKFEKLEQLITVVWSMDDNDKIAGFFVRPQPQPAASKYLDYETKADMRLPFDGEWFVFWGGRTISNNYHVVASDQRFAYDMLIMKDGKSFTSDGTSKEQYYCWGESIRAPADGKVTAAVDGLPDNSPGVMDSKNPAGNHIFIDMGNDEFVMLAHLQQQSVAVNVGDEVSAGEEIGRCGNSGNTSEPHIHFHVQDKSGFGVGEGKPAFISNYNSNGIPIDRGEPKRGETVNNSR